MSVSRQQRRHLQRQEFKAAKRKAPQPGVKEPSSDGRYWVLIRKFGLATSLIAALLSLSVSSYFYWPSLEITPVPGDNSDGPMKAKFEFRNIGRTGLSRVAFECVVNTAKVGDAVTGGNSTKSPITGNRGQKVGDLSPGGMVVRNCGGGGIVEVGPHPSNVWIRATYDWPYGVFQSTLTRYFVSETDGSRVWMTPEPTSSAPTSRWHP